MIDRVPRADRSGGTEFVAVSDKICKLGEGKLRRPDLIVSSQLGACAVEFREAVVVASLFTYLGLR